MSEAAHPPAPQATQSQPKAKKNPAVVALAVIGSVLGLIGIFIGSMPVSERCGSPFSPESKVAELMDTMVGLGGFEADCMEDIGQAAVWTWLLIIVGIAMILVAIIVATISKAGAASQEAAAAPSGAGQIEELARLRDNGLISNEEFEAKKAEILSRM